MGPMGSIRDPRLDQRPRQVREQGASLLGAPAYFVPGDGCPVWSLRSDGKPKGPHEMDTVG